MVVCFGVIRFVEVSGTLCNCMQKYFLSTQKTSIADKQVPNVRKILPKTIVRRKLPIASKEVASILKDPVKF